VADGPEEFAEAVNSLLRERPPAEKMGKAARKQVERCYSWEKNLAKLEDFLP